MLDATVTSKGQITIPIDIRAMLDLKPGDKIRFVAQKNGDVTLRRKKKYTLDDLLSAPPRTAVRLSNKQLKEARSQAAVNRYERSLQKPKTSGKK